MSRDETITELESRANDIRISILEMLAAAGSGHTAGPLGMADILAALYFKVLRHDPANPDWDKRDYLQSAAGTPGADLPSRPREHERSTR
jgi:transketolase